MKQKIILGIVVCIMTIVIGIYGYSMLHQDESFELEELINNETVENKEINQNGIINNSSSENFSEDIRTR